MEIPGYQPFYLETLGDLRAEIARIGLTIPLEENLTALRQPILVAGKRIPNRFCAQPIAGNDAQPDGSPGELTRRRYRRYTEGKFGLIWMEMTAVDRPAKPRQLCLNEKTASEFRRLTDELRGAAVECPILVLQLKSAQPEAIIHAAALATEAGFDGVDFQCPRDVLADVISAARRESPALVLAVRICAYDAVRHGFGVSVNDFRQPDLTEPIRLVQDLVKRGLGLLNVTAMSPRLRGPERGMKSIRDVEAADENPLMTVSRQLHIAQNMRAVVPGVPVIGSGFGWLRNFVPEVAAGALRDGMMDVVGLGRGALAHPFLPAEVFARGRVEAGATCMVCFACAQMSDEEENVGCVLRDPEVYGPVYRQMRRFHTDRLLAGAARCHLCEAAPCVAASPTRIDIPAFIQAYRNGEEKRAFEIIRARDPLPEMTAQFAPGWLESEGACIEKTLTGVPVPILDLQYAIAWRARERGETGLRIPAAATGRHVAVIGGGPAGLAATIRLLELGHEVTIFEQSDRLGGVPARLLAATRQIDPQEEIEATLHPALKAKRLQINFGSTFGSDLRLSDLEAQSDAILIATGLWQERSLGAVNGVLGALEFIESKNNSAPNRVAILAGGDAAMDAAQLAQKRGAREIFIIFGGPRSAMHWHAPESWLASPGVQAMMNWEPLGYEIQQGNLRGVRLRNTLLEKETILPVDLVIEAMQLEVANEVQTALVSKNSRVYFAGATTNGGASVGHCVSEGLAAAENIHDDLSS